MLKNQWNLIYIKFIFIYIFILNVIEFISVFHIRAELQCEHMGVILISENGKDWLSEGHEQVLRARFESTQEVVIRNCCENVKYSFTKYHEPVVLENWF